VPGPEDLSTAGQPGGSHVRPEFRSDRDRTELAARAGHSTKNARKRAFSSPRAGACRVVGTDRRAGAPRRLPRSWGHPGRSGTGPDFRLPRGLSSLPRSSLVSEGEPIPSPARMDTREMRKPSDDERRLRSLSLGWFEAHLLGIFRKGLLTNGSETPSKNAEEEGI
jgi:hypothetical protein